LSRVHDVRPSVKPREVALPRRNVVSTEQVLDVACDLVATSGPDQLHLVDLARACGVAVGTVYNHFPSKEHLLAAVSAVAEDQVIAAMDRAAPPGGPLLPALPDLTLALLQLAGASPLVRVLLRSAPTSAVHAAGEGPRIRSWIAARVTTAQAAGEVGPADADAVAHLAFGLVRAGLPLVAMGHAPVEVSGRLAAGLAGLLPPA
jgi:AcrR family transcriptional regulator